MIKVTIRRVLLIISLLLLFWPFKLYACSRVAWNTEQGVFAARSMDWGHSFEDILYINPRGMKMIGEDGHNPAKWTSKYGSVVQSIIPYARQYGFSNNDGATDGINEKGLTAHILYLGATRYAKPNNTPGVSYMRWLRFILDNHATVADAVIGMKNIRISPVKVGGEVLGAHMAIEDPSGDSAIFEIIDGKLVVHHGKKFSVMTNDPPYGWQLQNLPFYQGFGGLKSVPGGIDGADRFVRLSYYQHNLPKPANDIQAVAYLLSAIRTVAVPFGAPYSRPNQEEGPGEPATYPTWWLSVIDLKRRIYYFNWVKNPNIVWVDLHGIDFSKGTGKRAADPKNPQLVGDITKVFQPLKK
ncbi:linear amide C-N hydrolase [Microbulbifer sp. ANSA001]|uniref:linear amide C-N hydrolase n=1 Tax=Microbulbifer sp. ANSA001 TaxID=3243358 RepID=UPI0040415D10